MENLEKQIPFLQSLLITAKTKPKLLFYEGVEGIKKIYFDHLLQKQPMLEIVGIENIHPKLAKYIKEHYIWERIRRKIFLKTKSHSTLLLLNYSNHLKNKKPLKIHSHSLLCVSIHFRISAAADCEQKLRANKVVY